MDAALVLAWLLPALCAAAWLFAREREARRNPLNPLIVAALIGAGGSSLLGALLLHDFQAVNAPVLAWLTFPVPALALRALARRPADFAATARTGGRLFPFQPSLLQRLPAMATPGGKKLDLITAMLHERKSFATEARPNMNLMPRMIAGTAGSGRHDLPGDDPVLTSAIPPLMLAHRPAAQLCKTVIDVTVASAALLFLSPLLLVLALLVSLDGGPVLFAHTRIGRGGNRFPCLKFRSMVVDSESVLRRLLETDPQAAAEWAATQKLRRDPRITWIGRFLRSTSLDELPQLFNVVRRDMSIVGPRPIVGAEVARYGKDIGYYLSARPGITGLWQVSGRSDTSYAQRVALDTAYVRDWSLWKDVEIVARTVPAVLKRKGAV